MNNRLLRRLYYDHHHKRKRFLKTSVIGFGFLSGLWVHIGVDPSSVVAQWLERFLLTVSLENAPWITLVFLYGPTLLTIFSLFFVYRHGGVLGFIAVALAYTAGLLLSMISISLFFLALIIGWFAARRVR